MNLRPSACSSWIVRIWSSWAAPVPPILKEVGFAFTAAMYSLAALYGVSAFTQRMNWSSAIRATGVRSRQLNGMPVWRGVVKRLESVMIRVWASPFFPLTSRKPSAPAPPDLLTTMSGRGESLCFSAMPEIRRAIWSAPPPVPAGTTNSIGFVGLLLEVLEVLLGEVREAALLQEVLAHGLALPPLDDRLGLAVVPHLVVLDLVEGEDTGLDRQLAELVREHGIVVPPLGARVEGVDEGRPADRERAAHLVHHLHRVRGAHGRHVAALGMPGRHHAGHVLLPARVNDALGLAGGAEGRVGAVGRHAGELDIGVGVRLVVVEQDEAVVLLVGQRRRDRAHAHVGAAAVPAERDHVDRLGLHLALAHERFEAGRRAERRRARRAQLCVHPRHDPRRRVVRRVRDVHAAGGAEHDRARARGLHHELHDQRGLAPLAGPVTGGEVLLERDLLDAPERLQDLGRVGERRALSHGRSLLFSDTEPVRLRVGLAGLGRTVAHVGRLVDVLERDLATAEAADEREQRRAAGGVVEGPAGLVWDHARSQPRAQGGNAVDDAERLRPGERRDEPVGWKRPEPPQPDQTHLLALRPHLTNRGRRARRWVWSGCGGSGRII